MTACDAAGVFLAVVVLGLLAANIALERMKIRERVRREAGEGS